MPENLIDFVISSREDIINADKFDAALGYSWMRNNRLNYLSHVNIFTLAYCIWKIEWNKTTIMANMDKIIESETVT